MPESQQGLPSGEVSVQTPEGDAGWAECLRDLKRSLEGGSVFVLGNRRRYPVSDPTKSRGDVSREACEEAFEELSRAIDLELLAQAADAQAAKRAPGEQGCGRDHGCVRPSGHDGACVNRQCEELPEASPSSGPPSPERPAPAAERERLARLVRRVAASISVAPGMQAVLAHDLPPALWQPTFAICIGRGEVRVLTLAYVGEPVAGDRPSCKRAPFMLKVVTDDLAAAPAAAAAAAARYAVEPAAEGVTSTVGYLQRLEPRLYEASEANADRKAWAAFLETASSVAPAAPATLGDRLSASLRENMQARTAAMSRNRSTGATPGGAQAPFATAGGFAGPGKPSVGPPRQIGDRASRMREGFARVQSPAAALPPQHTFAPGARNTVPQPRLRSVAPAPQDQVRPAEAPKAAVSVLADGLSVRSIAGAWNNMAASTSGWLARARSPAGNAGPLRGGGMGGAGGVVDRQVRMRATLNGAASRAEAQPLRASSAAPPHLQQQQQQQLHAPAMVQVDRAARMRASIRGQSVTQDMSTPILLVGA
mmetsp:Transcript_1327/g.5376  ORF Transcript_1327/g.5376 Transcript_1327/m.5376 type:complete len:538 (+) Transcript_1327:87-1700(+)|eukprot:CAMPEP_0203902860 /NCGR_PEP_ID=MMETSP0359-20131031/44868_1 /ASSEMBLY_ACC=CAM_ASM_000338 /TAXON_ID=268821 /ORGANISM="Scrippsiella Hangoei, Strain SHTV-5" /LENGTH=537 /DNA_ID=CAMNT_0050826793 /DNA_START=67 /DNA_END=1680 /DNA_ORIENTATION=+